MPNIPNRPQGRPKNVSGAGSGLYKRGSGVNTGGPVGRQDGYAGRKSSGVSRAGVRAGGGAGTLVILALVVYFLLKSCGGSSLLGAVTGGSQAQSSYDAFSAAQAVTSGQTVSGGTGGSAASVGGGSASLSSLLGGFSGGSTVSTGWDRSANVGKLDSSVASGARAKRTQIVGQGADVVTIMIYMCGTDLESKSGMATADLQEIAAATIPDNLNILVYTGGCKSWRNNIMSNSVNQIYKVESGGLRCLVQDDGKDSLVKPATLTRFIKFCAQNYPANRFDLIFWDHGGGSISGYGYDEKNASLGSMGLSGIDSALKNAGVSFDFIGFDACLMATLETGLMLEPYADYLIASEETEPGIGWYYTNWVTALGKNTSMATLDLGKQIVDDFVAACNQRCAGQKTTLSVVDLAELKTTVPTALKKFAGATSAQISGSDYKTVSDARAGTREFAASSKIDQVDLVHLATKLGTPEGEQLAQALLGAVKYNKTSSSITNAYGISIYFPYQRTGKVSSAVAAYQAIGMDSDYTRCIQEFAGLTGGGQSVSGASGSPLDSLFGAASGGVSSELDISSLLGAFLGGGEYGRSLDVDAAAQTIADNQFDGTALVWTNDGSQTTLRLSEEQWSLVHELELNVFYDDGEGYIDLGLDNVFSFTDDGALIGDYDGTWLAIDSQVIPYYYVDSIYTEDSFSITGRVPVLLNGERAELLIVFDTENPDGYIAGARTVYLDGQTDTVAKEMTELQEGDTLDLVCDYYSYDGDYQNSYLFGEQLTYKEGMKISNVTINKEAAVATYLFRDIYNQEYWTTPMN